MTTSPWSCYCGHLARIKFRQVRCVICRTECSIRERSTAEIAEWLMHDYREMSARSAILLTVHTMALIQTVRTARQIPA